MQSQDYLNWDSFKTTRLNWASILMNVKLYLSDISSQINKIELGLPNNSRRIIKFFGEIEAIT